MCQEELAQRLRPLTRGARSSVMRQDHHGGSVEYKNTWLFDPQTSAASKDVRRRPLFLKDMDFTLRRISVDKPKWWSNGGQTHSQTK
jgi:hypothetical protein